MDESIVKELDERIEKAQRFLENVSAGNVSKLEEPDCNLLLAQMSAMATYSDFS